MSKKNPAGAAAAALDQSDLSPLSTMLANERKKRESGRHVLMRFFIQPHRRVGTSANVAHFPREIYDKLFANTIYSHTDIPTSAWISEHYELYRRILYTHYTVLKTCQEDYGYGSLDDSWLIEITDLYIDLLKNTPRDFPDILRVFDSIVKRRQYLTNLTLLSESQLNFPGGRDWSWRAHLATVDQFISTSLTSDQSQRFGQVIRNFFDKVVDILARVFDEVTDNMRYLILIDLLTRNPGQRAQFYENNTKSQLFNPLNDEVHDAVNMLSYCFNNKSMFSIYNSFNRLKAENGLNNLNYKQLLEFVTEMSDMTPESIAQLASHDDEGSLPGHSSWCQCGWCHIGQSRGGYRRGAKFNSKKRTSKSKLKLKLKSKSKKRRFPSK